MCTKIFKYLRWSLYLIIVYLDFVDCVGAAGGDVNVKFSTVHERADTKVQRVTNAQAMRYQWKAPGVMEIVGSRKLAM
jgi:hypothetical protein